MWVGTGEGSLITYDVFMHQGSKTPSDSSSFVGSYTDSFSALAGKEETAEPPGSEGFDPVREAAMRVRVESAFTFVCFEKGSAGLVVGGWERVEG